MLPKKVAYVKSDVRECSVCYKQEHFCYSLRSHSEEESRMNSQQITHLISQDTHAAAHEEGLEVLEEVLEEALSADSLLEDPEADSPEADSVVADAVDTLADSPAADSHAEDTVAGSSHVAGSVVGSLEAPSAQVEADAHTRMVVANPAACAV